MGTPALKQEFHQRKPCFLYYVSRNTTLSFFSLKGEACTESSGLSSPYTLHPTPYTPPRRGSVIKKHLSMVFVHEIDPSFPQHQQQALTIPMRVTPIGNKLAHPDARRAIANLGEIYMTRDEAVQLMVNKQPCFYTGGILKTLKGKPLFIFQISRPPATLLAAKVGELSDPCSDTVWIKLSELNRNNNQ